MATRIKKFKPIVPIVWESIVERCARMNVRPSFSPEAGIVLRIGDRVFAGLSVKEVADVLLTLEAAYAAIGYECYACTRVTFNGVQSTGYRLCDRCLEDWLY